MLSALLNKTFPSFLNVGFSSLFVYSDSESGLPFMVVTVLVGVGAKTMIVCV